MKAGCRVCKKSGSSVCIVPVELLKPRDRHEYMMQLCAAHAGMVQELNEVALHTPEAARSWDRVCTVPGWTKGDADKELFLRAYEGDVNLFSFWRRSVVPALREAVQGADGWAERPAQRIEERAEAEAREVAAKRQVPKRKSFRTTRSAYAVHPCEICGKDGELVRMEVNMLPLPQGEPGPCCALCVRHVRFMEALLRRLWGNPKLLARAAGLAQELDGRRDAVSFIRWAGHRDPDAVRFFLDRYAPAMHTSRLADDPEYARLCEEASDE